MERVFFSLEDLVHFWYFIIIVINFTEQKSKLLCMYIYTYKKSTIYKNSKILQQIFIFSMLFFFH